jgi:two-component system sensor histidine kinase TctE
LTDTARAKKPARPPSLRRRLLGFLLVPMLVLLLADALFTYGVALRYSNHVGDGDLGDDARSLAQMLKTERLGGELSGQARFLLEYDPDGHNYFSIVSSKRGQLSRNGDFPVVAAPPVDAAPVLYDSSLGTRPLRAASLSFASPHDPADVVTVNIAENLHDRHERARQILLMVIPIQTLLIAGVLLLVWFGVNYGLRILHPLTRRLAAREHELGPITDTDVPQEILPLTRTIDGLFARLRGMLAVQERFLADAAHQLRTPLTGLSIHVERALTHPDTTTINDALYHIGQLTERAARTSAQLLAMTRAQSPLTEPGNHGLIDLNRLIPELVALHVHQALRAGVDLGYQAAAQPVPILGDAASLQELLDNLLENALRYAGRGSWVTVGVRALPSGGGVLQVEDNGPGVAHDLLPRLGERFFRAPGSSEDGTGLGLAIVQQIAAQHQAEVLYAGVDPHGLSVTVQFPAPLKSS